MSVNINVVVSTTYSLVWIWSTLWVVKSSSYRAGLCLGLLGYWGTVINQSFVFLFPIQMALLYFFFLNDTTRWFRRRLVRYTFLGVILTIITCLLSSNIFENLHNFIDFSFTAEFMNMINRKAFNALFFLGPVVLFAKIRWPEVAFFKNITFDFRPMSQLFLSLAILFLYSFFFDAYLIQGFGMMWPIVFFALIPLELIFQSIGRLRSRKNFIYLVYIIICFLDSHIEGRVKIFLKFFEN